MKTNDALHKQNRSNVTRLVSNRLVLLFALLLATSSVLHAQFTYVTNNGTITITGYTGLGGDVTIPSTIDGFPVTSIGNSAFAGNSNLTYVTIPTNVVTIGYNAFLSCTALASITIPVSVTNIGGSAFASCDSLSNVAISSSVISIGDGAFGSCQNLMAIEVDSLNPNFSSKDGILYNKDQTILFQCPAGVAVNFTVPDGVTNIYWQSFSGCTRLTNVTISKDVSFVARFAFATCSNLASITVDSLNSDFAGVDGVLFDKRGAALLLFPRGRTGSYTIPSSVTSIGGDAFYACAGLTNVSIPEGVRNIGNIAFRDCDGLVCVSIPNSVTNVDSAAFYGCERLIEAMVGRGVTTMGTLVFESCHSLQNVYFQGNAPSISRSWFYTPPTVYYLPGTIGWGATFAGRPTAPWILERPTILSLPPYFGLQTNQFGFRVSWATNVPVVIEACTTLSSPAWTPLRTNNLAGGWTYFSDPEWTNYPNRIYRVRQQ